MSGHYWKWRMHGGAVTLAKKFHERNNRPDLILATDMLNLPLFKSLTSELSHGVPTAIYFHENQLTYPWSPTDRDVEHKRDAHYAFINYSSAYVADHVYFNSHFHREEFLNELPKFLKGFPDHNEVATVEKIRNKSSVLHLGMDLKKFDAVKAESHSSVPIILWNHRWEYDKNPDAFFATMRLLKESDIEFKLAVVGEMYHRVPEIFEAAKKEFGDQILQFGYCETWEDYAEWVKRSSVLPITSNQDFFGGSLIEGMYCDCTPFVPNRLAYPEHFPPDHREKFVYSDEADLLDKLKAYLKAPKTFESDLKKWVEKYDWSQMATVYDQTFEKLVDLRLNS